MGYSALTGGDRNGICCPRQYLTRLHHPSHAALSITPEPESLLRVFMAWKALDAPVDLPAQTLPHVDRSGFTVVEWGGTEVS